MTGNAFNCTQCGRENRFGNRNAATVQPLTCWDCGHTMFIDQYRMEIVDEEATKIEV